MRIGARLFKYWGDLQSSYWFIPALMALGAIGLSFLTTQIDGRLGSDWIEGVGWLYANKPAGARAVLSTIAGSMIGVAGVTFSITIASVSFAAGQFGPRILTNFMRDRGNQITLGTFIATFLYCLLILRTVRSADEATGDAAQAHLLGPFVPHVAILVGLVLALASLGVLIYFIHHIPESILISNVIAEIGRELSHRIETLFPERFGEAKPAAAADGVIETAMALMSEAVPIRAQEDGYLQHLNPHLLLAIATEHDLVLHLRYRPGDFVSVGKPLVLAWPPDRVTDQIQHRLRACFAAGRHRTQDQDVRFLFDELVEIAARGLSPGVNDPFTAISCLDWLGNALITLAGRSIPSPYRYDDAEALRVIATPTPFTSYADLVFGQLRPYLRTDRNAALHAFKIIAEVGSEVTPGPRRAALRHHADALLAGCETALGQAADREEIRQRHRATLQALHDQTDPYDLRSRHRWLGGSA